MHLSFFFSARERGWGCGSKWVAVTGNKWGNKCEMNFLLLKPLNTTW